MAQHVDSIMLNLEKFVDSKLSTLSVNDPIMALMKPFASRIIGNNLYKVRGMLSQLADKDGLIDVEGILSETIDNVINTKPFKLNTGLLGDLEIGAGKLKMDVPFVNKTIVLNQDDLKELKDMLMH